MQFWWWSLICLATSEEPGMSVKSSPAMMGWCELSESALQSEPIYVQFTAFVYLSPWKSPVHLTLNRTRRKM